MLAAASIGVDAKTFTNPVIGPDWPDPTVIDGGDGYYYSIATHIKEMRRSRNLIDWESTGVDPISKSTRTVLANLSENIWAPSLARIGGKWLIYVSVYHKGDIDNRIVVLQSDKVTGPYIFKGEVINGSALGILNTIDPFVFEDEGNVWMFFGSCQGGIHRVRLSDDGMRIRFGCVPEHVAGLSRKIDEPCIWGKIGAYEGSYLVKRHGWWYLFVSGGKYTDNTYYLTVGRSRTVDGEFVDSEGRSMLKGLAEPILESEKGAEINGAGHNGDVFSATDGSDWIFIHAHDTGFKPDERPTFLQELKWNEEKWPYFENRKLRRVERRFTPAR